MVNGMKITAQHGSIESAEADTVIVSYFERVSAPGGSTAAIDAALGGAVAAVIAAGDASGELGHTTILYPQGAIPALRVVLVGLGPARAFDEEAVRVAAASAARRARDLGASHVASVVHGAGIGGLDVESAAQATVEGTRLGLYRFDRDEGLTSFTLVESDGDKIEALEDGTRWGEAVAEGVALARDLVRRPANVATPEYLAEVARTLGSDHGFAVTVGDRAWMAEQGMGALLAVAQAAGNEPRFLVIEHDPSRGRDAPTVLVGKGVTFDSGGLSIKGRQGLEGMKEDMAGAAAVLGTMRTIGRLRSPRRVIGLIPATENVIDAFGFRPSDVVTAGNGTTIEIISTDAEGRLLLADALHYASRLAPRVVVDLATLTGAVDTALGRYACGLFSNDDAVTQSLQASGERTRERVWRLPLWDGYLKDLESDVADLKNSSGKPSGGACVAAAFLERFTDYPWVHLDIAGVRSAEKTDGYRVKGPTGFGVRLLVDWITRA
jgi:leucyl aminopeptidase